MHPLSQANTTVNISSLSSKQLLGQCIDLAHSMFIDLIMHYTEVNPAEQASSPLLNKQGNKIDFLALTSFVLEPSRMEKIFDQYLGNKEMSSRQLMKTWMFELKNLRNCWAHSNTIEARLALRGFETLSLIYEGFSGSPQSQLSQKIQFYRKTLAISQAQSFIK